jgi:CRP-like cAMP-binding protein
LSAPRSIEAEGRNRLVLKLQSIFSLSSSDEQRIRALPMRIERLAKGRDIVSDGERPKECCAVLEGFLCRYKVHPEGRRQIFSLHYAGDLPDLQSLYLRRMDHSLATLTPAWLGYVPHAVLLRMIDKAPHIRDALWRDTLIDAAIFREAILNIGQRSSYARIAHVFCEMAVRAKSVRLNDGNSYLLPLTQIDLADHTGMTPVHVNRMLAKLRAEKLIAKRGRTLTILDWDALVEAGEFDAAYLHRQLQ